MIFMILGYKKFHHILTFIILLIACDLMLHSDSTISEFEGGKHRLKARILTSFLTGPNAATAIFGNTASSILEDPLLMAKNPAALTCLKKQKISLEIIPPFLFNLNTIYDFNPSIEEMIDEIDALAQDRVYPRVDPVVGQIAGLNSIALNLKLNDILYLGVAYQKLLEMDVDLISNGISGVLTDSSSDDTTRVVLSGDLYSGIRTDLNRLDLAMATKIIPELSIGAGLAIVDSDLNGHLTAEIDGIIRRFGDESDITQSFNNPIDAQNFRNTLNDSIRVSFRTKLFLPKLGISYNLKENFVFDAVYNFRARKETSGNLYMVKHFLGAVDPDGLTDSDIDLFDQTLIELSRMTYTNRIEYSSEELEMKIPDNITLAAGYSNPSLDITVSYEKPLGNYLVTTNCNIIEDGRKKIGDNFEDYYLESSKKYRLGLKINQVFAAGFRLRKPGKEQMISLGTRIFFIERFINNVEIENDKKINILNDTVFPSFSLGLVFPVFGGLSGNLGLISFPLPLFRFSLNYVI